MRADRKLWMTVTTCAVMAAGVTGCAQGEEKADPFKGLAAEAIADKALATTKAAASFRVSGTATDEGEATTIDFSVDDKSACKGTTKDAKGGEAEVIGTAETTYMKGNDAFWASSGDEEGTSAEQNDSMGAALKGRWLAVPTDATADDPTAFCDPEAIVKDIEKETPTKGVTRGEDADVDGTAAATLVKKDKDGTTTFYVAKDAAKPYLLRVARTGGKEPGTLTFGDYGKPVTATAPPAGETLTMEQLMKTLMAS